MDDVSKGFMIKAQQCLAKNDFVKALDHLDAVIRRSKPGQRAPTDALDRRAATYIQLQRFADAFQDSKRMIREHKTDARGYLRTVQVLKYQAKEKKDDAYIESAIKVAKSGLSTSSKSDAVRYKQLARVLKDLENPPEVLRHDPARKLPTEILIEIFSHLRSSELLKARRISKSWNNLIIGNPSCWRSLKMPVVHKFNTRGIATLLNFATDSNRQCHLTELSIGWSKRPKDAHIVIRNMLKKCSRLRTLDIPWWYDDGNKDPNWDGIKLTELKSLTIRVPMSTYSLWWLSASVKAFPSLEDIALMSNDLGYTVGHEFSEFVEWPESLPNLQSFTLSLPSHVRRTHSNISLNLPILARSAPKLKRLELGDLEFNLELANGRSLLSAFGQLRELRLSGLFHDPVDSGYVDIDTNSPIHTLELNMVPYRNMIQRVLRWDQTNNQYSTLKQLLVTSALVEPSDWLQFLKKSGCRLEKLTIVSVTGGLPYNVKGYITTLAEVLEDSLTELSLMYDSFDITDDIAKLVADRLPNLEVVSFPLETSLTGVGIHALTSLKCLRYLDVGRSPQLSLDVVPFCRQRGVELRGIIGAQEKEVGSGRLVRYG